MKKYDEIMDKLFKKHGKCYLENSMWNRIFWTSSEDTKQSANMFSFANYHRFHKHNFFS